MTTDPTRIGGSGAPEFLAQAGVIAGGGAGIRAGALALTVIDLPLALANLKLIPVSLAPLGKDTVAARG